MKKFKVYTSFTAGGVYVVKAKNAKQAEENYKDFESYKNDDGFIGDRSEEVYEVEEIK